MSSSKNILLVEDDILISIYMEMKIKKAGHKVCKKVTTGEEAVSAGIEKKPDVILMDIRLAGNIDGVEAACRIREFSEVPIIFLTGYQDDTTRERAEAVNPLAFLIKPADFTLIQELLDS